MQFVRLAAALVLAAFPFHAASACAPPPPGYVYPTAFERLERHVRTATDILYGVIVEAGARGEPSRLRVLHVYRGAAKKGDIIEAPVGWDHPEPFCAGMSGPPDPKPVGTYGVIAFRSASPQLAFITPSDVQTMIGQGWIKSAQAR